MNKDEVMKLAREAGFDVESDEWHWLERFADLVAAHKTEVAIAEAYRCGHEAGVVEEREACAKLCDIQAIGWETNPGQDPQAGFIATSNCAAAIRNRGTHDTPR